MSDPIPVLVPLVNPNETDSILSDLRISEGQKVTRGDVLAEFETTKSTAELHSEHDGFVLGLRHKTGDTLRAGQRLCYLADTPGVKLPTEAVEGKSLSLVEEGLPQGLRITRPALELARSRKVNLEDLPRGVLVTESSLLAIMGETEVQADPSALIIYGGGGHAKSLVDLIRAEGKYRIEAIVDDGIPAGTSILDIPVLGGGELLPMLHAKGVRKAVNAVGGIGNIQPRLVVYQKLIDAGFQVVSVIHPRAFVEPSAVLADGCQVFFNAYIGSDVRVGFGAIVNTGAIISHDCQLGTYANISPGAILAGAVTIGERALVGMGVTINLGVKVGAGARIGNSAVVKADVPENGIVRAGTIWPVNS